MLLHRRLKALRLDLGRSFQTEVATNGRYLQHEQLLRQALSARSLKVDPHAMVVQQQLSLFLQSSKNVYAAQDCNLEDSQMSV